MLDINHVPVKTSLTHSAIRNNVLLYVYLYSTVQCSLAISGHLSESHFFVDFFFQYNVEYFLFFLKSALCTLSWLVVDLVNHSSMCHVSYTECVQFAKFTYISNRHQIWSDLLSFYNTGLFFHEGLSFESSNKVCSPITVVF